MDRWFNITRTVEPGSMPLERDDAKAHCRVDHDDEDDLIDGYIKSAVDYLDGHRGVLGRCLIDQTWSVQLERWGARLVLPFPDCKSVAIAYRDTVGDTQTLPATNYETLSGQGRSEVRMLADFNAPSLYSNTAVPITATFVAGYGSAASDVPWNLQQALRLLIAHWYEHRQSVGYGTSFSELPDGVDRLIAPSRVNWL